MAEVLGKMARGLLVLAPLSLPVYQLMLIEVLTGPTRWKEGSSPGARARAVAKRSQDSRAWWGLSSTSLQSLGVLDRPLRSQAPPGSHTVSRVPPILLSSASNENSCAGFSIQKGQA